MTVSTCTCMSRSMHRNLLLHPLKHRQTQSPGTSSASTLMIGGFLSLHQSAGLRTTGFAWNHSGLSPRHHREKTHRGFTPKNRPLVQLQVHKRDDSRSRKCQIRGLWLLYLKALPLSCASEITSLIWGTSHFPLELMKEKESLNKKKSNN